MPRKSCWKAKTDKSKDTFKMFCRNTFVFVQCYKHLSNDFFVTKPYYFFYNVDESLPLISVRQVMKPCCHTKYYNKNITKKNNKNKNKKIWNNYIKIWLIIKSMKIKNNINNKIRTKKIIIIRNYLIEKLFKIIIITVLTYIHLHLNIRFQ